jgi:hypothetical protein
MRLIIVAMVWVVEKKVFYHILDLGFESVGIPVRVKFEFEVKDGSFVPNSLTSEYLYNQQIVTNRYPSVRIDTLEDEIQKTIQREIQKYLKFSGYIKENKDSDTI